MKSAGLGAANVGSPGKQAGDSFADIRREAGSSVGHNLRGATPSSVDQTDSKVIEQQIKAALGRPTTRVILDQDDNIILNTGDIITNRAVEAAREAGVLDVS